LLLRRAVFVYTAPEVAKVGHSSTSSHGFGYTKR
jgi:hypothetical protein